MARAVRRTGPGAGGRGRGGGGRGGGRGGFLLGGRGARGQSPYQGSATYTFGGSALDTPPYQLRPDVPSTQPQFSQNNFGATFGGPLKIPGLYQDTNRRTNFQVNYTGNQSNNVFDQYATVPTARDADRRFLRQRHPAGRSEDRPAVRRQSDSGGPRSIRRRRTCWDSFRRRTCPATAQNYHVSTTAHSSSDSFSLRLTQNLSPTVAAGRTRRRAGRAAAAVRRRPRRTRRTRRPRRPRHERHPERAAAVPAQPRPKRSTCFRTSGGTTTNTSITAPISLNIARDRSIQNFTVNLTHATVRDDQRIRGRRERRRRGRHQAIPAARDRSAELGRAESVVFRLHRRAARRGQPPHRRSPDDELRLVASDRASTSCGSAATIGIDHVQHRDQRERARQLHVHRPLLLRRDRRSPASSGADFADFLLGVPQQASLQVGGTTQLRQRLVRRLRRGQLAEEREADVQPRPALRAGAAVRRGQRPDGQPGRRRRISRPSAPVVAGGDRPVHRRRSRPACSTPTPTTSARASASRTGSSRRHDPARRLQHHLQQRVVRDHRPAARRRSRRSPRPKRSPATATAPLDARGRAALVHVGDDEQLGRGQGLRARDDPDVERAPSAATSDTELDDRSPATRARRARTSTSCARRTAGRPAC